MAPIGKPKRRIVVEPLPDPAVPQREPERRRERPAREEPRRREKVPAK